MLKAIYKSRFSYVVCRMVVCGNCRWWGSFFIHELITILWCYDFSVMRRWGESKGALAVSWLSKKEHSPKYSLLSRSIPSWLKRWRVVWGAWSISCKNSEQTVCGLRFIVECMDGHRRDYDVVKFCCELLLYIRYTDADSRKELSDGGQIRVLPSKGGGGGGESGTAHREDPLQPVVYYATPAGSFLDIYAAWKIDAIKSELNMT